MILLSFLILRFSFFIMPFWGLEYEDSFIFNEISRMIYYGHDLITENLAVATCVDGSISNPLTLGIYGGHFAMFPYVVSLFHNLFGYHESNIFIVNTFFSILIPVFLYFMKKNIGISNRDIVIFVFLSILTPFLATYNTSGFSETFSSFIIFYFILLVLSLKKKLFNSSIQNLNKKSVIYSTVLLVILFLIAIYTKRENIVLIFPVLSVIFVSKENTPNRYFIFLTLTLFSILILYFIIHNTWNIETLESSSINGNTFSTTHFLINIKSLLIGFFSFDIWGITGLLFITGFVLFVVKLTYEKKIEQIEFVLLIAIFSYIFVYSSHYRSYYHEINPVENPQDSLRYATNYTPIMLLFIMLLFRRFVNHLKINGLFCINSVVIIFFGFFYSMQFRQKMHKIEALELINEMKNTLQLNQSRYPIITDRPSLYRCYTNDNERVIDYYALPELILDEKNFEGQFILIHFANNEIEKERFNMKNFTLRKVRKLPSNRQYRKMIVKIN